MTQNQKIISFKGQEATTTVSPNIAEFGQSNMRNTSGNVLLNLSRILKMVP